MASSHEHEIVTAVTEIDAAAKGVGHPEQQAALNVAIEALIKALGDAGYCLRRGIELPAA